MKIYCFVLAAVIMLGLSRTTSSARPVDLSAPAGGLGASNARGYLEVWREIEEVGIDFGKGSFLPIRYKFSSDPSTGGLLGSGFVLPMFEARNLLIREDTMHALLPCGKSIYLWRDEVDGSKFQSVDKEWTGALKGDDFTIWRDDGWVIAYHQGRLASITTDEHRVFNWNYDLTTQAPTTVSEKSQSLVTLEMNSQGLASALVIDGKRYEMDYGQRPLVQVAQGQSVVRQLVPSLSNFKYPDGKADTFQFALTPEHAPNLTATDRDQNQEVYTWDSGSTISLRTAGLAAIGPTRLATSLRDMACHRSRGPGSDGKTESISIDTRMGTYSSQASDGAVTVTHIFEAPGPLYHKVKSVDRIDRNKLTIVYKASYDEFGRLIRKIDSNGLVTTFQYDLTGHEVSHHMSLSSDPIFLASIAAQEQALLKQLKSASTSSERDAVLENLIIFYTAKSLQFDKAEALLKTVTNRNDIYTLKLCLALNPNHALAVRSLDLNKLIQEFPDKKSFTENLQFQ